MMGLLDDVKCHADLNIMYIRTYVYVYVRTYVCTYVCMHIRMYVGMYVQYVCMRYVYNEQSCKSCKLYVTIRN